MTYAFSWQTPRTVKSLGDHLSKLRPFPLDLCDPERCPCNRGIPGYATAELPAFVSSGAEQVAT